MNRFASFLFGTSFLATSVIGCDYGQVASTTAVPRQVLHESAPMLPASPRASPVVTTSPSAITGSAASPTATSTTMSVAAATRIVSSPTAKSKSRASSPTTAIDWERVEIPDAGLSVEVPKNWQRQGIEWTWAPSTNGPRVGVNWNTITSGSQPAGMLPNHAKLNGPVDVDLGWAKGKTYTAEVSGSADQEGKLQAVEMHTLVQLGGKRAFDFCVVGKDSREVASVQPIIKHLAASVILHGG